VNSRNPPGQALPAPRSHSVRDFVEVAFAKAGLDWLRDVEIDARHLRPTEVDALEGDAEKATGRFHWRPRMSFEELVGLMVRHDIELARRERMFKNAGYIDPA
jgi:GDPmannose 4,6-dehydratase